MYGRKDLIEGTLVNFTDGGEGVCGWKASDETRKKISDKQKGENGFWFGKKTWNYGIPCSHVQKLFLSKLRKGKALTKEQKEKRIAQGLSGAAAK